MARERQGQRRPEADDWDDRRGTPKNPDAAKTVDRASGRYTASGQAEEKQRRDAPRPSKKPVGSSTNGP